MNTILQLFRSPSRSDSTSDTGWENHNQNSNISEATLMQSGNSGLQTLNQHSPRTMLVAQASVNKILSKDWLSICEVDTLIDLLGKGNRKSKVYKELHALHCVHYSDMPKALRDQIPNMINELLTDEPVINSAVSTALNGVF